MTKSEFLQYTPPDSGAPLAFVITEFHALLLYADHVKGISLLNHELVFEDVYTSVEFCLLPLFTRHTISGFSPPPPKVPIVIMQ
jgi:hypothetical protein